jgi:sugar phosphate isomerase/epimerase
MINIKFYCPRWGSENTPWNDFANQVKAEGFDGVEVFPLQNPHEKKRMLQCLESAGLEFSLINAELKEGRDFIKYIKSFEQNLYTLASFNIGDFKPQFITSQTGREYYTKDQIAECFAICERISNETGIPIYHETHRNKWSFAAHVVKDYLQDFPFLQLTLDLSHWVCVSESFLEDQQEAVDLAILHSMHLHARVGHTQGPQVTDPRAPENQEALQHHLKWWDQWICCLHEKGIKQCTITPEFGPYPYMSYHPYTNTPIASQWEINCWMKNLLKKRYDGPKLKMLLNNHRTFINS